MWPRFCSENSQKVPRQIFGFLTEIRSQDTCRRGLKALLGTLGWEILAGSSVQTPSSTWLSALWAYQRTMGLKISVNANARKNQERLLFSLIGISPTKLKMCVCETNRRCWIWFCHRSCSPPRWRPRQRFEQLSSELFWKWCFFWNRWKRCCERQKSKSNTSKSSELKIMRKMDGYSKWLAHTHTLCTHRYCYPVAMGAVVAEALPSFGIRCRWSKRHATVTHLQDDLAPVCCILLEQKWLCSFQHIIGLYLSADPCRQQGVRVREASTRSKSYTQQMSKCRRTSKNV